MFLALFSAVWMAYSWGDLTMDEVLFQMTSPLEGTSNSILFSFALFGLLPAIAATVILEILLCRFAKTKGYVITKTILSLALLGGVFLVLHLKLDIINWTISQNTESGLVDENYVDPRSVSIVFPEEKRNLIYIYLESMETTFSDKASGGLFKDNCIPELTTIALENECFSGDDTKLNGGVSLVGSTWTMGAIFSQSAALPLRINIEGNLMSTQANFFPAVTTLGDILESEGYNQLFIAGSDATFGGRRTFFLEHGNFAIDDHPAAQADGRIPGGYRVWWGYEDKKLFEFAKQDLLKLASEDKPFNCTILTVDTHFEDGYVCEDCGNEFKNDQYANVYACSSKKVSEFLKWIRQQDFYENTTVILCGDHPTMDKDFCSAVTYNDRKVYVAFVNAAPTRNASQGMRQYSTFDMFPTTLAALGVEIEGNKLGLGTNLYSGEETLLERYSRQYLNTELQKKTDIIRKLEVVDYYSKGIVSLSRSAVSKGVSVNKKENGNYAVTLKNLSNNPFEIKEVRIRCLDAKREPVKEFTITEPDQKEASAELSGIPDDGILCFDIYGEDVFYEGIHEANLRYVSKHFTVEAYLDMLAELSDTYSILVAVADEASYGMTPLIFEKMSALGLHTDLSGKFRYAYYGVIDGDTVYENCDPKILYTSGTLRDGAEYKITSAGWEAGSRASITIDDSEYSLNSRGLNFVIYDTARAKVIDSACFDTYSKSLREKIGEGLSVSGSSTMLVISASDAVPVEITKISARQVDDDGREYYNVDLMLNDDGQYVGELSREEQGVSSIHVDIEDNAGHFVKDAKIIDDLKLVSSHFTIEAYLDVLSELPDYYSVLAAVSNEASYGLTPEISEKLKSVGFVTDLTGKFRYSYYGVKNGGTVKEDIGLEKLTASGILWDGSKYQVTSAGWDAGSEASIVIDDIEYSTNSRGLHFVVYDTNKSKVVDTVCFDTYSRSLKYMLGEKLNVTYSSNRLIIEPPEDLSIKIGKIRAWQLNNSEITYVADFSMNKKGLFVGDLSPEYQQELPLHFDVEDNEGHYLTDIKSIEDIKLASSQASVEDYLEALSEAPETYSIIISVSDEASNGLTDSIVEKMQKLGFATSLMEKYRYSFYGIIDGNTILEESSPERLEVSGFLRDGADYHVISSGYDAGSLSSVIINGVEYSKNSRGLNFVIYDTERSMVIDSACFDTFQK